MNSIFDSSAIIAARQPDEVDEVDANTTYIGFFQKGDSTQCLILRIHKIGTSTSFQYPNGSMEFNQDWNGRAALNYNYKK